MILCSSSIGTKDTTLRLSCQKIIYKLRNPYVNHESRYYYYVLQWKTVDWFYKYTYYILFIIFSAVAGYLWLKKTFSILYKWKLLIRSNSASDQMFKFFVFNADVWNI